MGDFDRGLREMYGDDFYKSKRTPSYNLSDIKKNYSDNELLSIIDIEKIEIYLRKIKLEKLKTKI